MTRSLKRFCRLRPVLIGTMVGAACILALVMLFERQAKQPLVYIDYVEEEDFGDASFENGGKWYGLCERDSIRSIEDFRRTVANDQTLRVHFADFRWGEAVVRRIEKATPAYVYYRKGDVIFRKAKTIVLPAGDEYITDGKTRVRTHCCNDYTEAPPLIASDVVESPEEPLPESAPKLSVLPGTRAPSPPISESSSQGTPSWLWPAVAGGMYAQRHGHDHRNTPPPGTPTPFNQPPEDPPPPPPPDNPPPVPVPEPNGMLLLGFSIVVIIVVTIGCYRGVRRNKESESEGTGQ